MRFLSVHFNIGDMIETLQIPLLKDNYSVIVRDADQGWTLVVDPAEAAPVEAALEEHGWLLTHILNTHWHGDHVGGNRALKARYGAEVYGAAAPGEAIPGLDHEVWDLDAITLHGTRIDVLRVSGHTPHHVAYWFSEPGILFAGDTLFGLGCGRLLGGTAEALWDSLDRIRKLPKETQVYCAHEYTESNARFAASVEPQNKALANRRVEIARLRAVGLPTVPFMLAGELDANPFLRPESPEIRSHLGMSETDSNLEVFRALRQRKDQF
jgi:hydroxyacylglutathione hydrolase